MTSDDESNDGSGGNSPLSSARNNHLKSGSGGNDDSGDEWTRGRDRGGNDNEDDIPTVALPLHSVQMVEYPKNESGRLALSVNRQRCRDDIREGTELTCFKGKQCFTALGGVVGDTVWVKWMGAQEKGEAMLVKSKLHVRNIVGIQNCVWCRQVLNGMPMKKRS